MQYVEVYGDIRSSVIGFGCAPIMGSKGASESRRALDMAMAEGVNHLDLARSYGYGEAESFVGKCIKGKRNQLVLASKFGIEANWKAALLKPIKPLVRKIRKPAHNAPKQQESAPVNVSDRFHDRLEINCANMLRSLENSLKAIGTDHLDYYFIHEPHQTIIHLDEVLELAEKVKSQGKVRAFGLAFMRHQSDLHKDYLNRFDVLQFDNSPGAIAYDEWKHDRGSESNILFSPLSGGDRKMDAADKLKTLHRDFPKSVILCSMFKPEHVIQNTSIFK